jgi:hypothetical protein
LKKIPLSLGKLLLRELGYGYHKVPFSLGKIPFFFVEVVFQETWMGLPLHPFFLWKLLPNLVGISKFVFSLGQLGQKYSKFFSLP